VLHEILGLPNVKNYDGSWTEYGSLVGVPLGEDGGFRFFAAPGEWTLRVLAPAAVVFTPLVCAGAKRHVVAMLTNKSSERRLAFPLDFAPVHGW
jgi:hypothetical protein